jgi:hypothetical protein
MLLELNLSVSVDFIRVNECFKIKRETIRKTSLVPYCFLLKKIITVIPLLIRDRKDFNLCNKKNITQPLD